MNKSKIMAMMLVIGLLISHSALAKNDFKPVKFERDSLSNGLQIIYCIDKSAPIVATVVHYKVGSRDENPERTGFAHFFEHLMFEGTTNIPRASIDKYVEESGGWLNAHTSFDETVYKFRVPANEIQLPLWIESQRMRGLLVDSIGVETQRGVVKEERKMRTDNTAYGTMFENMAEMLYGGTSYQWTPIGYEKHINQATVQEFRNFYDNFYQPNNAVLAIVGDFKIEDARKYVRQYFGDLPRGKEPKREPFKLSPLTKSSEKKVDDAKAQLPGVFVGYRGPKLAENDYYAMSLLSDILASGESSRLYQRLVDQDRIAVQAQLSPMSLQFAGVIMLVGIPSIGKDPQKVLEVMTEEVDKIAEDGVTEEELTKAKNITEGQIISANKTALEKAQSLARYLVYFNDASVINTEFDKYGKVTVADIKNVAKKYFGSNSRAVLFYMPKSAK
jgi:predicted Zn-dependent peptidase